MKIDYDKIEFKHPQISISPAELTSLKEDWNSKTGPRYQFIKSKQEEILKVIDLEIDFPPEGGNHNQWYQCESCQFSLKTISDDEHFCAKCQTTYQGQPYVGVVYRAKHVLNFKQMYMAALLHHLEGDKKYFEFSKNILLGYAARYESYEFHDNANAQGDAAMRNGGRILPQSLDEAVALCEDIAPTFDLLFNSLSSKEIETIRSKIIAPITQNLHQRKSGISNWQSWHNDGILYGAYMLEDIELIKDSIADAENGFLFQLDHSINAAGMWYESSWAYHDYAMSALTYFLSGAKRIGISLWDHPKVQLMYEAPLVFKLSNGDLPRLGDSVETNINHPAAFYSAAYASLPTKSKIEELIPKTISFENLNFKPRGQTSITEFKHESSLIEQAGMAILRNNQSQKKIGVSVNFAEFGGFHGHFDKLSFTLHAYDQELGVDAGRSESQAYRLPIHREWYRSTLSHNTIMIGSKDQAGVTGKLLNYEEQNDFSYCIVASDDMYEGVKVIRHVIALGQYLLIFDTIDCQQAQDIDWLYHNHGNSIESPAQTSTTLDRLIGGKYINNLLKSEPMRSGQLSFINDDTHVNMLFSTNKDSTLYTGNGLYKSVAHRVPMMILSAHEKSLKTLCLLEPLKEGEPSDVKDISFTHDNETIKIQINQISKSKEFIIQDNKVSTNQ